jgi:excisionase family DNA binding protein
MKQDNGQDSAVTPKKSDNLNLKTDESRSCFVCRDLLANLDRFFTMLEAARRSHSSDWLTVDDVAQELKISKSIVYRLIRNGELEAVNIVEAGGRVPKKGHYRVKRPNLNKYLEAKRITPPPNVPRPSRCKHYPNVKNHLGLLVKSAQWGARRSA